MIEYIEISWCHGWPWTFVQEHWSLGSPPLPVCPDNTLKYHMIIWSWSISVREWTGERSQFMQCFYLRLPFFYFFYLCRLAQHLLSFSYFSWLFYLLHFVNHLCRLAQPPCKRAQRGKVAKKLGKTAQTAWDA